MKLTVNGEQRELRRDATVTDLLTEFSVHPARVAVEINEKLVRRTTFAETRLNDGDRVEIVTLVGGG